MRPFLLQCNIFVIPAKAEAAVPPAGAALPDQPALIEQFAARDEEFFRLFFEKAE